MPSQRLPATIVLPEEAAAGDYDVQVLGFASQRCGFRDESGKADEPINALPLARVHFRVDDGALMNA